ncbi:MAG TPA: hypothetical protein H9775_16265 [Candidatus Blautia merdipullorum]|nr:hypothetical protein [Candidatus Blautia merdipullorum]
MDITSLGFLLFLGGGVTLFYSIPQKYRWKWLIVLSFAFVYAASAKIAIPAPSARSFSTTLPEF